MITPLIPNLPPADVRSRPQKRELALHACLRDLVALSAMPACWIGKSYGAIAESLRDVLVGMLHPDTVYVEINDRVNARTHVATAHGKPVSTAYAPTGPIFRDSSSAPLLLDSEVAVGLASLPIGIDAEFGRVAAGSARPHFPTRHEKLLLQVAANQVAVALRHGELLIKHEKAEQQLAAAFADAEETSRMKSQFLGMMSHELRTPLNAIGGYVQLLEEGIRGPMSAAQLSDLARIRRSQQHLLGVIENVLGFLKLGSGKVTYDIAEVSLDEVVANVEEIMMPMIDSKSLKYSRQVETEHLKARADQKKTQQIVLNLLSNAVKFTESGSDIGIHVVGDTATVHVSVVDGGCGIPPDRLQQVFEPFVQVSRSGARSAGGTGLGLSISREFARGMGGDVVAQSSPGVGSTFTLELPRADVA